MKAIIHIETSSDIRIRQQLESLEKDRAFWQNTAERLQNQLDGIYDAAQADGRVTISRKNKPIALTVLLDPAL